MNPMQSPARKRPFSYICSGCSRCCKDKIIRVNPYEAARLASFLQISTSDFLRRYTWAAGTILRMPYKGNCIFRNTGGCSVHEARPLVCRLYPLRRHTSENDGETFDLLDFEPNCVGLAGNQGTVADYLSEQKALEYLDAVDMYVSLVDIMADTLRREIGEDPSLTREASLRCAAPPVDDPGSLPEQLDMDPVVSRFSAREGLAFPRNLHEKTRLHIKAIETWLAGEVPSSHRLSRVKALTRTLAMLGYSIGVNLDEIKETLGTPISNTLSKIS